MLWVMSQGATRAGLDERACLAAHPAVSRGGLLIKGHDAVTVPTKKRNRGGTPRTPHFLFYACGGPSRETHAHEKNMPVKKNAPFSRLYLTSTSGVCLSPQAPLFFHPRAKVGGSFSPFFHPRVVPAKKEKKKEKNDNARSKKNQQSYN